MAATMSLLSRLFAPKTDPRDAMRPLWQAVVAEARRPAWYTDAGVADTVNGRYEMVSAVYALVLLHMERDGDLARDTAYLTELYVEDKLQTSPTVTNVTNASCCASTDTLCEPRDSPGDRRHHHVTVSKRNDAVQLQVM